jgi:hypothetical protein
MIRRLSIAALMTLAPLTVASSALAQSAPVPGAPASATASPDGPMATARRTTAPPPDAAPEAGKPAPIARTEDLPNASPETRPTDRPKRQQIFISPMGEPFRAPFGRPYPVEQWFTGADTDHDGLISQAEFRADAERFFKVLDANHDNVIDGFEVGDYETKVAPEILPHVADGLTAQDVLTHDELQKGGHRRRRAEDAGGDPAGNPKGALRDAMTGAALFGFLAEPEPVRGADADLDFHISHKEWMAAADRRFEKLDKNHDKKLERAELPLTPMQKALADEEKRRAAEAKKGKR